MDEAEFNALYRSTAEALRLYIDRVCGERRIVEDLLQETYYRLLHSKFASPDPEEMRRYLFRIAANVIRDHWRKTKRLREGPQDIPEEVAVESRAARLDVRSALKDLKPRERELLWLAYAEEYSHSEIASILGLGTLSVRVLLFRARRKMLRLLRPTGGETS